MKLQHRLKDPWITDYAETHSIPLPKSFNPMPQAQESSTARITGQLDGERVQVATFLPVQPQHPPHAATDDNVMLLEEYVGDDDEEENIDSEAWDSPNDLDFDSNDYNDGYDNANFDPY